jgi:hypothetical protein
MRGRPLWSVVAATLAGLAAGYALGAGPPRTPEPAGKTLPDIPRALAGFLPPLSVLLPANEASGIVASRRNPGVYFWLRDGGPDKPGRPRTALWGLRIDESGQPGAVHGDALFPAFPVTGASNVDWEALTIDDAGDLWIGQLGANDCRSRQGLHRVAEPDPATESTLPVLATYDLRFPDNPKSGCRTYNSEAMFWIDGHLYLFAKTDRSPVYRVDLPEGDAGEATLTRIGQLGRGIDNISASSVSDDRTRLMVLDHKRMWVYEVDPARRGDDLVRDAIGRAPKWQATFEGEGGATVEGGTFARGSHRLAFVAEDRRIYVTDPQGYGDVPSPVCPTPDPGASVTPDPSATPTPDPGGTADPGTSPTPSPDFTVDPIPATAQPTTSST